MVKRIFWARILLVLLTACRQSKRNGMELDNGPMQLEQTIVRFNNAMVNADSTHLAELISEDLTYGHSSGLVQDKMEFINDVIHGPFDFSMIENQQQRIQVAGRSAIVRHIFKAKATHKGEPMEIRIGNVQVYRQNDAGVWQLWARQAFKL